MKLVACETVAAIVVHLRIDDQHHKPTGGLYAQFLCDANSKGLGMAWDKPNVPVPESPEAADEINKRLEHSRWCSACVNAWRMLVIPEKADAARAAKRRR